MRQEHGGKGWREGYKDRRLVNWGEGGQEGKERWKERVGQLEEEEEGRIGGGGGREGGRRREQGGWLQFHVAQE